MYKKSLFLPFLTILFLSTNAMAADYLLLNRLTQTLRLNVIMCEKEAECKIHTLTIQPGAVFHKTVEGFREGFTYSVTGINGTSDNRRAVFGLSCRSELTRKEQQAVLVFEPVANDAIACIPAAL